MRNKTRRDNSCCSSRKTTNRPYPVIVILHRYCDQTFSPVIIYDRAAYFSLAWRQESVVCVCVDISDANRSVVAVRTRFAKQKKVCYCSFL